MLGAVGRDADKTREKLMRAATDEFAARGEAGARIDRIAECAGVNKRMIYAYFGNKEELFAAVQEHSLGQLIEAVPLTADDLPGYAGRLFDYLIDHPERHRLALWRTLENSPSTDAAERSTADKLAALSAARPHDSALDPASLLIFIMALVRAWPSTYDALARPSFADAAAQRAAVVRAVHRLTHRTSTHPAHRTRRPHRQIHHQRLPQGPRAHRHRGGTSSHRPRTAEPLFTIELRLALLPGVLAEGQIRGSASARLGQVQGGSRRMRPPKFLLTGHRGGAHARSRFHPARPVFDSCCRRAGRACRSGPRQA